jgi:hypothetical protein
MLVLDRIGCHQLIAYINHDQHYQLQHIVPRAVRNENSVKAEQLEAKMVMWF